MTCFAWLCWPLLTARFQIGKANIPKEILKAKLSERERAKFIYSLTNNLGGLTALASLLLKVEPEERKI